MNVGKWNYQAHEYDPYELPKDKNCSVFAGTDMEAPLDCASCGKTCKVSDMYSSQEIHALPSGFAFNVCPDCHEIEYNTRIREGEIHA